MAFHDWECTQNAKVRENIVELKASMNKKTWWKGVIDAYHVMMPVMYAICNLDQKALNLEKALGKIWGLFWAF